MIAGMMSIFNGRWPEMSSFNIFIKTSHFDQLFCFKQTNLCNSLKYSFSLQRQKYININSTVCIRKKEKKEHTHAMNMHRTHRYAHGILQREGNISHWQKGGIIIIISGNFCTVLLAKHKEIHSFKDHVFPLDFTVSYVGKTVFIYQIQTQKNSRKLPNEYTIKLTIILTMNYMMGIFYEL